MYFRFLIGNICGTLRAPACEVKMINILITRNPDRPCGGGKAGSISPEENTKTLLLREGLRDMGMAAYAELFTPDMLDRTEDGKPFLAGLPGLHFNLSHSGDYIACAFSDQEVGLDLQEHSRPHTSIVRIARRFFTAREYEAIHALPPDESGVSPDNSDCRLALFYRLWSIKEAYLKYLGCGLRGGMDGYLPDPFPDAGPQNVFPSGLLPDTNPENSLLPDSLRDEDSKKTDMPPFLPDRTSENILLRGQIRVIREDPLLRPAEYAVTVSPENYTMVVSAAAVPREVKVRFL